jgi:hypothetical protein
VHRTEVTTETTTVTVQTVNLVGVSVISNVSTPLTASPAPTTLVMSTIQANGTALNTTMPSSATVVVVPPLYGSPLSYASPTGYGQPLTGDDGDGDDDGDGALSSNGEEGSDEAGSGSGSYWDGGEYNRDTNIDEGDAETGPWALGSAPDSEEGGSESEEQSGGSSFLDWLLEILK